MRILSQSLLLPTKRAGFRRHARRHLLHRPAHVHILGVGGEAVFILNCPGGPPELRESYGFNRQDIARIRTAIAAQLTPLCHHWSDLHGHP